MFGEGRLVWTSPDGLTWTPAELPFEAPYVHAEISAIAVGEWGLVAVGSRDPRRREDAGTCPVGNGGEDYSFWPDAAVWTSTDGLNWDSVTDASLGGPWGQQINDVAEIGARLVAVGSVEAGPLDPSESRDPPRAGIDPAEVGRRTAVWTSVDGASWSRVPHDPAVFGAAPCVAMHKVVAGGPGLVAIGIEYPEGATSGWWDEGRRTVVWTSVEGQTWTRVPEEQHGLGGWPAGWPSRVVNIGGELIALDGPDMRTSVDGVTWDAVTSPIAAGPAEVLAECQEARNARDFDAVTAAGSVHRSCIQPWRSELESSPIGHSVRLRGRAPDPRRRWSGALFGGAGDENRTRTVSLGNCWPPPRRRRSEPGFGALVQSSCSQRATKPRSVHRAVNWAAPTGANCGDALPSRGLCWASVPGGPLTSGEGKRNGGRQLRNCWVPDPAPDQARRPRRPRRHACGRGGRPPRPPLTLPA